MTRRAQREIGELLASRIESVEADMLARQKPYVEALELREQRDALVWLVGVLAERLAQIDGRAHHFEGDGSLHGTCVLCGALWPCPGYADEVGDL